MNRPIHLAFVCLSAFALLLGPAGRRAGAQAASPPANGCLTCHAALSQPELSSPARAFPGDVHQERGFACVDCHGGDPNADDKARAKDPARGFRGKPAGRQIVAVCARCHSDAELMRRFAPRQRVDQAAEYASSVHGKRLAASDRQVATCVSCHDAHGIRRVTDVRAPTFPTNVAATCAKCHADPEHMKGYTVDGGKPIPTNQLADYEKSVHYAALTKGNDLSAPTCNDCHGNHGAAPPGIGAVANVCGTCHAVFAAKFAGSVHSQIFDKGCVDCHSNHAILRPSDDMLGTSPGALCVTCHEGKDDAGWIAAGKMRASIERLKSAIDADAALIDRVRNAGMEVGGQELALGEIRTKLTQARMEMHAFSPAGVDPVVDEGLKMLADVRAAGMRAEADLRFRRRGLFVSFGAILLVVVALALKIRELNRRRA
jgi:predicted CXXCH cytochrome family protein